MKPLRGLSALRALQRGDWFTKQRALRVKVNVRHVSFFSKAAHFPAVLSPARFAKAKLPLLNERNLHLGSRHSALYSAEIGLLNNARCARLCSAVRALVQPGTFR
jgi:hypothetical protein